MSARLVRLAILMVLISLSEAVSAGCVVLLHGLARTSASMEPVAEFFAAHDYDVVNVGYPSRKKPIEELAPPAVREGINRCPPEKKIHFVTHSLGGILLRHYLTGHSIPRLGRVVMLAPPNQGSEIVDALGKVPGFKLINGPAGIQLGTDDASIPAQLGPVDFELGIIAGNKTFNPILSQFLPNPDDGKVAAEKTKVAGMADFIELPHSHSFIMNSSAVLEQSLAFIETGAFKHAEP